MFMVAPESYFVIKFEVYMWYYTNFKVALIYAF